jgi:hypothetical protein
MITVSLNWALALGLLALCGAAGILAMATYFACYVATAVVTRVYHAVRRRWFSRRH